MKNKAFAFIRSIHISLPPRAQSLTEFALALPILLLLVFGIIEFGRIMQAWLALENGARFGVRYASTGSFNPAYCAEAAQALEAIFPGIANEDLSGGAYDCRVPDAAANSEDKNNALQDWARLPSIRDTSIAGSTGIAWDPAQSGDYEQFLTQAYNGPSFSQTNRGVPGEEGYFNVTICSNRVHTNGDRVVMNTNPFYYSPYPPGTQEDYRFPAVCQTFNNDLTSAIRFIDDAGGPGDRVRVILTYRHELIMPLLNVWWPTLRLTSEREALVEKFRTSRVTGLTGGIVYAPTNTFTPTITSTITTTPTLTPTLAPVYCNGAGSILRQAWTGVNGSSLSNLTSFYRYPSQPNASDYPTVFEQAQTSPDVNNYGTRWRAYLCPPFDGEYVFTIASDDASELLLSGSQDPGGATRIAHVDSYTGFRNWTQYASQASGVITLQGGQLYYIEAKQKEGSGGDYISVGWVGPNFLSNNVQIIEGTYLVPVSPEPTPTPEAPSCSQLVVRDGQWNDQGEKLLIEKDSNVIQSYLVNEGQHPVYLTGASMTFNGDWHNQVDSEPAQTFNRYYFGGTGILNPADISTYPFSHTFTTPYLISAYAENYFKWNYTAPAKFGILPNVVRYPPVSPTAVVNPYPGPGTNTLNFFWPSDYTGSIAYKIVPEAGPTVVCTVSVTGDQGPSITPQFSENPTNDPFFIRAVINGNNSNTEYVFFYVYNSSGTLVHWFKDTTAPFCFNNNCATLRPMVDTWLMGSSGNPGPVIQNGTYTVSIMAQNRDGHRKANRITTTFQINAATPTATGTSTRTLVPSRTFTPTKTGTNTKTLPPTVTFTVTNTATKTKIPTVTSTKQPSRTPTITPTRTTTLTPTLCLTPFEMGGCR